MLMNIGIISERMNSPLTGVGTYTEHLIKGIYMLYPHDKIYLIDYRDHEIFEDTNNIIIASWITHLPKKSYLWHIYSQFRLRKNDFNFDIIHSPENASLFIELKNQKKVVTAHDIIAYLFPESWITRVRYKFLLPRTLKTADRIIAVSNSTKRDIIKYFKIPEKKIKVVYNGVGEEYRQLNESDITKVRQKYNLSSPFILYVGVLAPNKNIPTLLKAFCTLKNQGFSHKLVIIGKKGWKYKEVFDLSDALNLHKDVVFTGYVPKEDLVALYNAADIFVYPSLYEGFGFPPLEAMACGTPVITSNTSSLPEIVGDAGIMVNPHDVNNLAKAMYEVLTSAGLRESMIKKGVERAKMFSWKKTAKETLKVYEEVCNEA